MSTQITVSGATPVHAVVHAVSVRAQAQATHQISLVRSVQLSVRLPSTRITVQSPRVSLAIAAAGPGPAGPPGPGIQSVAFAEGGLQVTYDSGATEVVPITGSIDGGTF